MGEVVVGKVVDKKVDEEVDEVVCRKNAGSLSQFPNSGGVSHPFISFQQSPALSRLQFATRGLSSQTKNKFPR